MAEEQIRNKKRLTSTVYVYTNSPKMGIGRPPKPEHLRRSKLFPLRLTPNEWAKLNRAARKLGESVAEILRNGGLRYIRQKGKGGSRTKGDKSQ